MDRRQTRVLVSIEVMARFPDEAKLAVSPLVKNGAVVGCAVDP